MLFPVLKIFTQLKIVNVIVVTEGKNRKIAMIIEVTRYILASRVGLKNLSEIQKKNTVIKQRIGNKQTMIILIKTGYVAVKPRYLTKQSILKTTSLLYPMKETAVRNC